MNFVSAADGSQNLTVMLTTTSWSSQPRCPVDGRWCCMLERVEYKQRRRDTAKTSGDRSQSGRCIDNFGTNSTKRTCEWFNQQL